ncbi:MAG: nucleotide exchange factor GrpE, partial [Oscillospiraceae bacterium]|nr:nucleotide exchange factor GrpE [Oscillospiraceae bacterium]
PQEAPVKDPGQLLAEAADKYLRLAAEYDNYRKRTVKEKESAWSEARAQTVAAFLPVYDNLERALKQETSDEAYKKGVEMTMKGLQDALAGLGVELIPALGETFDPNRHNAVMHCDDPEAGESTIVEVFQQGFLCGDKVIRFSMVRVAN